MWAPSWEAEVFMLAWDSFGSVPFTSMDLANGVALDKDLMRVALSRLVGRGWLIRLKRGRYLAKPLHRIVSSLKLHSVAKNALRSNGINCPVYLQGSTADLLASEGSDIDLLIVSEKDGWDEIELKLSDFHLTFIDPSYLKRLGDFSTYLAIKRGVPLTARIDIPEIGFDPKELLEEALMLHRTARVEAGCYEPHLLDAAGLAAKYLLYKRGTLPPPSSIGAIFELAKVNEAYLEAFRKLDAHRVEEATDMVIGWAKKIQ